MITDEQQKHFQTNNKKNSDEQQKVLQDYIDKDLRQQIELSDFDVTDKEPNAQGGIVGLRI